MNETSTVLSHCKRRPLIGRIPQAIMTVFYISFFVLACISHTVATTPPKATFKPITKTVASHLYDPRGGGQRTNRNWNNKRRGGSQRINRKWYNARRFRNGKLDSGNVRQKQASLVARRFWKARTNGWKTAVDMVAPKSRTANTQSIQRSFARVKTPPTTRMNSRKRQKPKDATDDPIEVRKPKPKPSGLAQYSPFKMYYACMGIVTLWILTGTFFYSFTNEWPIPQSFFYAVDAGMSIGFCTDVAETKLVSKAFTIIYIIMGASVVGGALALFIEDIVDGVVDGERKKNNIFVTKEYQLMLGKETFGQLDVNQSQSLTRDEFGKLLKSIRSKNPFAQELSEDDIDVLWTKFDRIEDGAIRFEEFEGTYRGIEGLLDSLLTTSTISNRPDNSERTTIRSLISSVATSISSFGQTLLSSENRIYFVFLAWVILGIVWGMLDQGWDPITATHFAISALATGGLTAPPVDSNGILPPAPAIFCGLYCLFGIPLMAITFGHFARVLVSGHVADMEEWALTRPITATDYEIAKQYLIKSKEGKINADNYASNRSLLRMGRRQEMSSSSPRWRGLRLSDFIVLQIFRQGRISVDAINILRNEFELLDKDKTGLLTLEEATNWATESEGAQ